MNEGDGTDAVGWLRFVEVQGGRCFHAGLFQTSVRGEPLGFSVARGEIQGPADECALSSLTESLLQSCTVAPVLLFGIAEEMPSQSFHALNLGVPFCRVRRSSAKHEGVVSGEPPLGLHRRMLWVNGSPTPESASSDVLVRIMQRDDPFEPLERAAGGLAEAFADPRVQALTEIPGLRTMMSLPPRIENAGRWASERAVPLAAEPTEGSQGHVQSDLAERLWAVLAVPGVDQPSGLPGARLEWPADLMPFQRDGIRALIKMDRLLLSDDMGLGKTVQAVAALRVLRARGEIESCLVVAPASVLNQWRQELARWAPELSAIIVRGAASDRRWQWRAEKEVTLVSYDVLRQDAEFLARLDALRKVWGVVVLDEAQRIKNRNDTSEAAKSIRRLRSWALTGTPIENDEEELASIMEFVDHDEGTLRRRYRPGMALRLRHRELQLRRKKGDVLHDLPPKLETRLTIPLHRDQRESYDKAERDGIVYLKSLGTEVGIRHVLELITRLKQICNADPRTGASGKLDDIEDRLWTLTAQGHKALVFSQYTSDTSGVAAAANHLRAFNPLTLTGDTPADERSELINQFKTGKAHKALIISLRAGGLGLNLQEASYVFHLDRWWNPAVERQAEDRSHRLGQTVKVNVIKYTCEDTIEQRIDRILQRKQVLFDRLVDDVSMDLSMRMSREELLSLFGLD